MSNRKAYVPSRLSWLFQWECPRIAKIHKDTPVSNTPLTRKIASLTIWNHNFASAHLLHTEQNIDIISYPTHRSSRKNYDWLWK